MQLFYVPNIREGLVELPAEEARHAVQVLRKRVGEVLDIVDGTGGWYKATITATSKRDCVVDVQLDRQEERRTGHRLTMAVSPTKSNDRFEWFLEKATEIGVDTIVPLQCKRTERPKIRVDRYEKVLVSAMKQSLQAWLPELHPLTPIASFLAKLPSGAATYIGWCDNSINTPLVGNFNATSDVVMLIGPEGDFTEEEVALAQAAGCQAITLGPNRLRTETAAVVAVQTIAVLQQIAHQ